MDPVNLKLVLFNMPGLGLLDPTPGLFNHVKGTEEDAGV